MIYPGYLLNPGDMFQVDPERVLFATGAAKDARERRLGRQARRKEKEAKEASAESTETTGESEADRSEAAISETTNAVAAEADSSANAEETTQKAAKVTLQDLLSKAKSILADDADVASAKRKQELRAFTATVRSAIGKVNKKTAAAVESTLTNLDDELNTLLSKLSISSAPKAATTSTTTPAKAGDGQLISKEDRQALREALRNARENPIDPSKPYATPWRPRPYMSAFAFIPRYLEVNQNICSAVYLRHPVVRPGLAEVPTPFAPELNQLAFTWYLRRR
jgi:ribosomal protein S4